MIIIRHSLLPSDRCTNPDARKSNIYRSRSLKSILLRILIGSVSHSLAREYLDVAKEKSTLRIFLLPTAQVHIRQNLFTSLKDKVREVSLIFARIRFATHNRKSASPSEFDNGEINKLRSTTLKERSSLCPMRTTTTSDDNGNKDGEKERNEENRSGYGQTGRQVDGQGYYAVYSFCTMSNLSLKPIDSFFGSYFLRAASWALSSFALIFRFKPCRGSLFAPPTLPLPVPCTWPTSLFLTPLPFSRMLVSLLSLLLSLLVVIAVVVCAAVVLSLCTESLEPMDFCMYCNAHCFVRSLTLSEKIDREENRACLRQGRNISIAFAIPFPIRANTDVPEDAADIIGSAYR
ncbi:hypothetical protein EAI_13880 [Harpegnathos saltator]|uniref:Uncharacterized protein n=1 Tax=Harpegnathos saltator TaxID=610380 RepID=E2BUG3_HARSA|nr:hypothetical protein EAI_13880 [Harpegnathos saltator]